jgi:hypothetical protein
MKKKEKMERQALNKRHECLLCKTPAYKLNKNLKRKIHLSQSNHYGKAKSAIKQPRNST